MNVLCTFPGKYGDLLWTLPTVRALARRMGEAIDIVVAAPFARICPLVAAQPYVGHCTADPLWTIRETAPVTPREPPRPVLPPLVQGGQGLYDCVFHLGYRGWPQRSLPFETLHCLNDQWTGVLFDEDDLDLDTPWITVTPPSPFRVYASCGFTDEHFELKYGLFELLSERLRWTTDLGGNWVSVSGCPGSRWRTEGSHACDTWEIAARAISSSSVFLGCNSALHVLAVACGIPVVMMEPNPHRHHQIFYPLGQDGPQVTLVTGTDHLPTFDARHVADALVAQLKVRPV